MHLASWRFNCCTVWAEAISPDRPFPPTPFPRRTPPENPTRADRERDRVRREGSGEYCDNFPKALRGARIRRGGGRNQDGFTSCGSLGAVSTLGSADGPEDSGLPWSGDPVSPASQSMGGPPPAPLVFRSVFRWRFSSCRALRANSFRRFSPRCCRELPAMAPPWIASLPGSGHLAGLSAAFGPVPYRRSQKFPSDFLPSASHPGGGRPPWLPGPAPGPRRGRGSWNGPGRRSRSPAPRRCPRTAPC